MSDTVCHAKMDYEVGLFLGERQCHGSGPAVYRGMEENALREVVSSKYYRIVDVEEDAVDRDSADNEDTADYVLEAVEADPVDRRATALEAVSGRLFDDSWDIAKRDIVPMVYHETVSVEGGTSANGDGVVLFRALRATAPSMYCRGVSVYREYVEEEGVDVGVAAGFAGVAVVVVIAVSCLLRRRSRGGDVAEKQYEADAIKAANLVLQKLSQQRDSHFSVEQFRRYTMGRLHVAPRIWEQTVEYLSASGSVRVINEEINGELRACWKWRD